MEVKIKEIKQIDVKYIQVDTEIRYWDDTSINGVDDINFYETKGEGEPNMPCAVKVKDKPEDCIHSDHWHWKPLINVETGQIENWTKGVKADVVYKVCDAFACDVLDADKKVLFSYEGYVPRFMCPREDGYGDYIDMLIDGEGYILDWNKCKVKSFILDEYESNNN